MSFWIAGAIIVSTAAVTATSIYQGNKQTKAIKNAQRDAEQANEKALAEARLAQDTAGKQAQAQIDAKRRAISASNTIFTNPLGIQDQATTAKKTLLGS